MTSLSPNRTRLLAKLDSAMAAASGDLTPILLCAPAGYGKSKLVASWLASHGLREVVRLRCLPQSADSFWRDLARSVRRHLGVDGLSDEGSGPALSRLVAELDAPLTLIIDDYHFTTTPENDLALLDLIGPHLRLVIIARRVCLLDGPLAARRVPMLCVAVEDLAFTPEEAEQHAHAKFDAPRGPGSDAVLELACGWPLAIRAAFAPTAAPAGSLATRRAESDRAAFHLDPLAALHRFALNHLESLAELPQRILLAASQVDVIDLALATGVSETSDAETRSAVHTLLELGLLMPAPSGDTEEFLCHPAIAPGLEARAERLLGEPQRAALLRGRAAQIELTDPFTAFQLYLASEAYDAAELVLARHFTTITDESRVCTQALRALPQRVLRAHPTFIAARLFLELPDGTVSPDAIDLLTSLWQRSLKAHLEGDGELGELRFTYLTQAMIATRLTGTITTANRISHELEAQLGAAHLADPETLGVGTRSPLGSGALPNYYREVATTALMAGELARARRMWQQLRDHAEQLAQRPEPALPASAALTTSSSRTASAARTARTTSDVESGRLWLLAALNEMSFTELLDGDIVLADDLLAQADELARRLNSRGPGISWVSGEISRAHLAYELGDERRLERAVEALSPFSDRIEHWPLLLVAQTSLTRSTRGIDWAIPLFESGIGCIDEGQHRVGRWQGYLTGYRAMLNTVFGRFGEADRILERLPADSTIGMIERSRRALFAGDNVPAILLAQRVGDTGALLRQRLDRDLVIACAAWHCGQRAEAYEALRDAATLLKRYGLVSSLWGVPYATLAEIAEAAAGAGIADIREFVASVPTPARAKRYEPLTEMELRTLTTVARHGSTNETAEALFITPGTVKKHLNAVYRKLDVRGRDEAVLQAGRMGLLET